MLIDLFPPTVKCGQSLHQILWEDWSGRELAFDPVPAAKPLSVMAYEVNERQVRSYVEPFAFGDSIPSGTLFVEPKKSLSLPLDELYREAWKSVPLRCRELVESPVNA